MSVPEYPTPKPLWLPCLQSLAGGETLSNAEIGKRAAEALGYPLDDVKLHNRSDARNYKNNINPGRRMSATGVGNGQIRAIHPQRTMPAYGTGSMHRNTHGGIRGSLLDIPMKEEKDTPEEADGVLIDRRDAVRHLRSPASRNIVSVHPGGEGSGRPKLSITTLPQVRELTPGSDEIIRGPEPIRCVCGEVAFD